jgi:hypothetical protein
MDRTESPGTREAFRPYRHLAVRVLARAFDDLANPDGSATDRESARAFLAGSGMLLHWCHVAALDPCCIVSRAQKVTAALDASTLGGAMSAAAPMTGDCGAGYSWRVPSHTASHARQAYHMRR